MGGTLMQNNPYVGPRPYERRHQKNFYGRNREARDLLSLILAERLVLFYAQSGAGKTSLLNAKVIPALETEGFQVLPPTRVSSSPPPTLPATNVPNVFVFSVLMSLGGEEADLPTLCGQTLTSFLQQTYPEPEEDAFESPAPLLLIVDQFEELFTSHRERWQDARDFFIQVRDAMEAIPRLSFLLAMREDYIAELDPYAALLPRRLRARFRMELLGPEGALEAISKPALGQGIAFAPGVAEQMVDDLRRIKVQQMQPALDETAGQPLGPFVEPVQLQVICRRLWDNLPEQSDKLITADEVAECGNIDEALTDFYESAVTAANQETKVSERKLRHWFSEELITPMQTRGLTLRGETETGGLPNAAVDVLGRHYIVRPEVRAGARWYELSHDRLVDPILRSNRAWDAARRTPLRAAAEQWALSRQPALLYRDDALKLAQAWAAQNPDDVEPEELEFLKVSSEVAVRRRVMQRLGVGIAIAGILMLIVVSVLGWSAARNGLLAYSKATAAESQYWRTIDQQTSVEYAYEAIAQEEAPGVLSLLKPLFGDLDYTEAEIALRQALLDFYPAQVFENVVSSGEVGSIVADPQQELFYAGLSNGDVWVWTGETETAYTFPALSAVRALALHPQQPYLAVGGDAAHRGIVRIWDIAAQQWRESLQVVVPEGMYDEVYALAYSPDGRYLATGGDYGKRFRDDIASRNAGLLRVWDLTTGEVVSLTDHTMRVTSVNFSPDGQYLASASSDKTVRLWEVAAVNNALRVTAFLTLSGHTDKVTSVAFSPTEALLATASDDRTIRLWDYRQSAQRRIGAVGTLVGHTREVKDLAFSRDGQFLLSGSRDATVRMWHVGVRNPNAILVLTGHTNVVQGLAFSQDSMLLATADGAGNIWIWDRALVRDQGLSTLAGHQGKLREVTFSPDGQSMASGDNEATAILWSLKEGAPRLRIPVGEGDVWGVTYSLDGKRLVTCSADDNVYVWDTAIGKPLRTLEGHRGDANRAVFSPDGRFLVTAGDDNRAIVWDAATWDKVTELVGHGAFYDVDYSPDGRLIAVASTDDNVYLWEVTAPAGGDFTASEPRVLVGHTHDVYSVDFSPDSRYLASGAWDTRVLLWSTETFTSVAELEHQEYVYSVAFSPNGQYLAVGARDRAVRLYGLEDFPRDEPLLIGFYQAHTDLVWSVAFSPDGKYLASSSWDGTIRRYLVNFEDVWKLTQWYLDEEE